MDAKVERGPIGFVGRRRFAKSALLGAMAGMAAASEAAAARPAPQSTAITLNWAVNFQGVSWTPTQASLTQALLERYWLPAHPGVRVNLMPNLDATPAVTAVLAGTGPDLLQGCCTDLPTYIQAGIVAPLDPLLRRDNINASTLFSPGHLAALRTPAGQMGLPAYDGPEVLLVNEDALDQLGVRYPAPDWKVDDAVSLWESASGRSTQAPGGWRYGATLQWYYGGWGGYWLPAGWGGDWMDASQTRALLDSPACVSSIRWLMDLFTRRVAIPRAAPSGWVGGYGSVQNGTSVMGMTGGWDTLAVATGLRGTKWNYYEMPYFPSGRRSTMINVDFVALSLGSRYPELAWSLFKFIAIGKAYQRFNMQTTLVNPSLVDMWDEWESIVQTMAPPMRGKNLAAYRNAAQYGVAHRYFRYVPLEANNLLSQATVQMGPPAKQDVGVILSQVTKQINALESEGPALEGALNRELAAYHKYVRVASAAAGTVLFPQPPHAGSGAPPTTATRLVAESPTKGTFTLSGAGAGVDGTGDNCTFAGEAFRPSRGVFSCRLVALSPAAGHHAADDARAGLMARGDLGDSAANVGLSVSLGAGQGVDFQVRAVGGQVTSDNLPGSPTNATGLIGSAVLLADDSKPAANYLLKPVWLKLVLDVNRWTPYTSLDGAHWTQAFGPAGVEFVGAFIGLFVTSNTTGQYLRAVFDHVTGFRPDVFVQIGTP